MHREPHGIGEGLIMGGKSLLMVSVRLKLFKIIFTRCVNNIHNKP